MAEKTEMPRFPSCFPSNFVADILPSGLPDIELDVFRVCKNGIINKCTFKSTYEEVISGDRPKPPNWTEMLGDPSTYSVSCNDTLEGAKNVLKCLVRHHPCLFIIIGHASSEMGPLQRTSDRKVNVTIHSHHSHFDWWLYSDSDPSPNFKRYEES